MKNAIKIALATLFILFILFMLLVEGAAIYYIFKLLK